MSDLAGLIERARAGGVAGSDPAETPRAAEDRLALQRVAQQFEAMLLTQMLREMRKAGEVEKDEEDKSLGLGTESFTDAIDAELGLHLAKNKGIGLTDQLMQAFDRMVAGTASAGSAVEAASHAGSAVGSSAGRDAGSAERSSAGPAYVPSAGSADGSSAGPAYVPSLNAAKVTSEFGWRSDPFTGKATFHKGVDLRAAYGEEVQAAAPGTVVFSGAQRGYGTTVVIEHADGTRSRYAHLSAASVEAGATVAAGQAVGRAGHSGRATGTHLHFEVTGPGGQPMSPGQWMQRWAAEDEA